MQVGSETSKGMAKRPVCLIDDNIAHSALRCISHDRIEAHQLATPEKAVGGGIDWPVPDVVPFGRWEQPALVGEMAGQCPGAGIPIVCDASGGATTAGRITAAAPAVHGRPPSLATVRKNVDVRGYGGIAPIVQPGALE
ncbi:hypothetical protein QA639_34705 [Bradyrhizobium pachyrhizi]|uniref:hypothetical protein n=1 Tax=Bradyrhizobium pachyrhizi TaxID=280333 RepID=UPI0024B0B6C0|nr:hypothetical protein [Bradyrhizobium pachyrhizi]WFU54695.1 hypothetical protein QA639_34705 [Bradyrhizobium pachyrhizi]